MPTDKQITMKVIAEYQYAENYAAHDWDGEGECPQYWKMKGCAEVLLFDGLTVEMAFSSEIQEWACNLAMEHDYYNEYASQSFCGLSIVPSNQIDRYEAMEAEMYGDYESLSLFDTQEVYQEPSENDPIDRFDKMAEELGMEGL